MFRSRTVIILLIIAIISSSFFTLAIVEGNNVAKIIDKQLNTSNRSNVPNEMDKLVEVYNKILTSYIDEQDGGKLIDGAIQGMVESLDDPHSSYMDAEQAEDFFNSLSDSFEGIGAEVTMENGKVTVVAPIKGSPSEKAGIQPRDQIVKVNGESLEGLNLNEAISKIRGPKGTKAVLEILRAGSNTPITVTVVRDKIPIETIHASTKETTEGLIGVIEITNFGKNTASDFKKALTDLEQKGMDGLIIDLRGNPGGYLQSALDIGQLVIPNNGIIVQTEDKEGNKQVYKSNMGKAKYPIVGIIDGGSASASEILAAALQEAGGYQIVGDTSYGKGTVQNPYELPDGSSLKITVAKWLTPDGNWIHQKGVEPDVKVSQPEYYSAMPFTEDVNLKIDMTNEQVKNLQIILNGLGYKTKRQDGYFDANTEAAVKAFQKVNNLEVTGVVDKKTAAKMQEEIIKEIRNPENDMQLQIAIETLLKLIK